MTLPLSFAHWQFLHLFDHLSKFMPFLASPLHSQPSFYSLQPSLTMLFCLSSYGSISTPFLAHTFVCPWCFCSLAFAPPPLHRYPSSMPLPFAPPPSCFHPCFLPVHSPSSSPLSLHLQVIFYLHEILHSSCTAFWIYFKVQILICFSFSIKNPSRTIFEYPYK